MERIGTQVKLPLSVVFQITLQGIKIRLGRSLVTLSGVVLGIAFLMNVLTGELISGAVTQEKQAREATTLMLGAVKGELGAVTGKTIGLVVLGALRTPERQLIAGMLAEKPAGMQAVGYTGTGVTPSTAADVGRGASVLLVLGDGASSSLTLETLVNGMAQPIVLDAVEGRFPGQHDAAIRYQFFGSQQSQEREKSTEAQRAALVRTLWVVLISLLVTVIGIANALLMSVTERFKEIGTMKCLGALSAFIRQLFLLESGLIGLVGSAIGVLLGSLVPMLAYSGVYGFPLVFGAMNYPLLLLFGLGTLIAGMLLSMLAAIYPANFAAKMVPAMALRSNV